MSCKILLLGSASAGKSSFVKKYVYQVFPENYKKTVGIQYGEKILKSNKKQNIILELWDISSNQLMSPYTRVYYCGATVAIIFVDLTNKLSFDEAILWKKTLEKGMDTMQIILVYNKCDIAKNKWVITKEEIKKFSKENGFINYFIISVKNDVGINEMINYIISFTNKEILKTTN